MAPGSSEIQAQKAERKRAAAARAVDYVQAGMAVGLGTGSTARFVAEEIALRLADGRVRDIICIPTSEGTRAVAEALAIPLTTLEERTILDIAIDGADEVTPNLDLVKGAGGALLREKIVAASAALFVVVVDDSKLVNRLGEKASVPIEVVRFGWKTHLPAIRNLGGQPKLRVTPSGEPFITDEGHFILDARFNRIENPVTLESALRRRAGVVETGLFLGMAHIVAVGTADGVEILKPDWPLLTL